jgi:hypothetical protein
VCCCKRGDEKSEEKVWNNEKGPENRGLWSGTCLQALLPGRAQSYFFFFGAAFFLGAAFFVALFID